MSGTDGNQEQIRIVAQSVAESTAATTIAKFVEMHPELGRRQKAEIPASLKLWGTVGAALLTLGISGTAVWLVSSVNSMQQTLARMDERQILMSPVQEKRFADLEQRTSVLENKQRGKP